MKFVLVIMFIGGISNIGIAILGAITVLPNIKKENRISFLVNQTKVFKMLFIGLLMMFFSAYFW